MEKRGYRVAEAVPYSGQPRSRIYLAIQDGSLKSYKVGRSRLLLKEDLDAWIDRLTIDADSNQPTPAA